MKMWDKDNDYTQISSAEAIAYRKKLVGVECWAILADNRRAMNRRAIIRVEAVEAGQAIVFVKGIHTGKGVDTRLFLTADINKLMTSSHKEAHLSESNKKTFTLGHENAVDFDRVIGAVSHEKPVCVVEVDTLPRPVKPAKTKKGNIKKPGKDNVEEVKVEEAEPVPEVPKLAPHHKKSWLVVMHESLLFAATRKEITTPRMTERANGAVIVCTTHKEVRAAIKWCKTVRNAPWGKKSDPIVKLTFQDVDL